MAYKDKSAAIKYNNKFIAEAYDRVNLTLPKGRKEELKAHAESRGGERQRIHQPGDRKPNRAGQRGLNGNSWLALRRAGQ